MTQKQKTEAQAKAEAPARLQQDAPTKAPLRDGNGFELDAWGLPISGPVRAALLAEMGMPDPHDDPKAWKKIDAVNLNKTEQEPDNG